MTVLTLDEVKSYAVQAGFAGDGVLRIVAIAHAESGFDTQAVNTEGNTPPSRDRGILQINDYWHKEVSDVCAFDPLCAFQAAYTISSQGTDFTRWTTFSGGPFEKYYREVLAMSEVAHFVDVSQFYPGKTEFACGFYSAGTVKYSGKDAPTGSATDIEAWADAQYIALYGEDTPTDTGGVSIQNMHDLIHTAGQHFQDLNAINPNSAQAHDIQEIKAALNQGYPVIATVVEASVYDLDLQKNPYWWGASGTHVFVITGMENSDTYLVRDSANVVGSLQGPNTVQPGPRRYDANKANITWATMVQTSWLPTIPSGEDPLLPPVTTPVITQPPPTPPVVDPFQVQAAKDCWNSTKSLFGGTAPAQTTGIGQAWLALYAKHNPGPPLTEEYISVDWNGKPITVQEFAHARCEWANNKANWYTF